MNTSCYGSLYNFFFFIWNNFHSKFTINAIIYRVDIRHSSTEGTTSLVVCNIFKRKFFRQSYSVWSARRLFSAQKLREAWIEFSWIADNSQLRSRGKFFCFTPVERRWFRRCWRVAPGQGLRALFDFFWAWLRSRRSEAPSRRGEARDGREDKGGRREARDTRWDRRRRATSRAQRHWRRARQPQRDPPHAHLSPLRPYSRAPYTSCTTATYPTRPPGSDIVSGHVTHHRAAGRPVSPRGVALLRTLHARPAIFVLSTDHALPRIVTRWAKLHGSTARRVIITLGSLQYRRSLPRNVRHDHRVAFPSRIWFGSHCHEHPGLS